jgi:hypothetical protein
MFFVSCLLYITVALLSFVFISRIRKKGIVNEQEYKLIIKLYWIGILLGLPNLLESFADYYDGFFGLRTWVIQNFLSRPLWLMSDAITATIGFIIIYRYLINPHKNITTPENHESLEESVKKIFNSNQFYSALTTSLPIGNKDTEFGLDYIPFMLQIVNDKRERFQKSSAAFLKGIIVLSIFFIGITIYFSYILLNESSVGLYKSLFILDSEMIEVNKNLSIIKTDVADSKYVKDYCGDNLKGILNFIPQDLSSQNKEIEREAKDLIQDFERNGNLPFTIDSLSKIVNKINTSTKSDDRYKELLVNTVQNLKKVRNIREEGYDKIMRSVQTIETLAPKIEGELQKPTNQQNELIKRLILSIVVISFFIAIIRYFRGLYNSHYSEMLKAGQEDLLIRKFYVAIKNTVQGSDERKLLYQKFLNEVVGVEQPATMADKVNSIDNEVVRDVLNAIIKKI